VPACVADYFRDDIYGPWHTTNFPDSKAYPTENIGIHHEVRPKDYVDPESILQDPPRYKKQREFDPTLWRAMKERRSLLYDFIHSYPVISMEKTKVYDLLGPPDSFLYTVTSKSDATRRFPRPDYSRPDCEFYEIEVPHEPCDFGPEPHASTIIYLELGYSAGRVIGFRIVVSYAGNTK